MRFPALVFLCVAVSATAGAQTGQPSDGSSLQGWKVEFSKADVKEGVLHVGKGGGWVRTERVYADFVLSMDIRIPADRSAAIWVRAWPTFSRSETPTNGYRLHLNGAKGSSQVHTVADVGNPQGHIALSAPDETVQFRAISIRQLPPPPPDPTFHPELSDGRPASGIQFPRVLSKLTPATREGKPIAVRIMLELEYNLR